jgi:putative transposase
MFTSLAYSPKTGGSTLVNSLKGVSSHVLRKERPDIQQHDPKNGLRSTSYVASSCGAAPITIVRQDKEQPNPPHRHPTTATPSALSFPALKDGA